MKHSPSQLDEKIAIDMTPMIDIVFQLLTFFIMTLQIAAVEGDFLIKMPVAKPAPGPWHDETLPPMKLRLVATSSGDLAEVRFNGDSCGNGALAWASVQQRIDALIASGAPRESLEVQLDCDYALQHQNVIDAITAVSGKLTSDGQIVKLVEKVKFAPPRPQ